MAKVQAATRRKSDKIWRDALTRALARLAPDGTGVAGGLDAIASSVINAAILGDMAAIKEVGDRMDGKAVQATTISGPDGGDIPIGIDVVFTRGPEGQG